MKTELLRSQVEEPTDMQLSKCKAFRSGQQDRKSGAGCLSANGAYLDGWYAPDKEVPPYVDKEQMNAFSL